MYAWLLGIGSLVLLVPLLAVPFLLGAKGRRSVTVAVRNLWLHKLRSFLSVLGIIIGTSAVISLMAFGEGSMHDALEDIKRQGATNIIALSIKPAEDGAAGRRMSIGIAQYGLTDEDYDRMRLTIPTVVDTLPMRVFPAKIRLVTGSDRMFNGRVVGTTPRYSVLYKLEDQLAVGRFLSERDDNPTPQAVCILGSKVAAELFPGEDALNKTIKISPKDRAFTVIGVLKERMPSTSGPDVEDFDGDVYLPLQSCRKLLGEITFQRGAGTFSAEKVMLDRIVVTVRETDEVRPTVEIIKSQLERYHDSDKKDWNIKVPLDRLEEAERTRDRYRVLLAFIAGISLLVGGIGIMNIMLATVTERTREIGIRRALGAKRGDITLQFLVEAVVQTTLGGVAGVALGFTISLGVPAIAERFWAAHLPAKIHVPSIFMAFLVAVGVGVLFGWYPSRRAARLDPIEALRHE